MRVLPPREGRADSRLQARARVGRQRDAASLPARGGPTRAFRRERGWGGNATPPPSREKRPDSRLQMRARVGRQRDAPPSPRGEGRLGAEPRARWGGSAPLTTARPPPRQIAPPAKHARSCP